jgi:hypothetical protein
MDFDANSLIASLIIGGIGTVSFIYGRKQSRVPQMVVGVLLIAYPYFISNVFLMIGIAVALLAALWASIRFLRL